MMQQEIDLPFELHIQPAAPGTRQMLAREQAAHQVFLKKQDPSLSIDLATARKQASTVNPGIQPRLTVTIGGKDFKLAIDNMSSEILLGSKAVLPPTAKKITTASHDLLSFATGAATNTVSNVSHGILSLAKGDGLVEVAKYQDTVSVQGLPLPNFDFLAASGNAFQMNSDADGILGIVRDRESSSELEGFVENFVRIFKVIGLASPSTEEDPGNGPWKITAKLTTDISSFADKVTFAPVIKRPNKYIFCDDVLFDAGITYGSEDIILDRGIGYYDPTKTFVSIPTDAFERYKKATGAVVDEATGLLVVTEDQYKNLATLRVRVGEANHDLIPNAQIWPRRLNNVLGGVPEKIYLVITDSGVNSGGTFDVVLGYTFWQRFLMILDAGEHRIGFGPNEYTYAADLN